MLVFFFFQAEDGIRYIGVTGVQTCALPICRHRGVALSDRVLSLGELNRATLARQLLLRRERLPVARALERVAGLQAQWSPSLPVALWTRLEGFQNADLERAFA